MGCRFFFFSFVACYLFLCGSCDARSFPSPSRQLPSKLRQPLKSAEDYYQSGVEAMHSQRWSMAHEELQYLCLYYPKSPLVKEALFHLGASSFHRGRYHEANRYFADYLKGDQTPRHFIDVFDYKYKIAEQWHQGVRKHLFNLAYLPRWQPAQKEALALYEEIYTALPGNELGAQALFASADVLAELQEFGESIEKYQAFITRFPRHPFASQGFLKIAEVYLKQAQVHTHDPDLLPLAEINVRKFRQEFPSDSRLLIAEELLENMREVFAKGLYETGRFFERTKRPASAVVYYQGILRDFPRTQIAIESAERLATLNSEGVPAVS